MANRRGKTEDNGRLFFEELFREKRAGRAPPVSRSVLPMPRRRRRLRVKWSPEFLLVIPVLAVGLLIGLKFQDSPWPPATTFIHMLAARNGAAARSVGLAPARRGEPGYYDHHDRDGDGWVCEPRPRRQDQRTDPATRSIAYALRSRRRLHCGSTVE